MVAAGWACWYMHIIPALRRLRQRIKTDFEISLRYIVRPCLKKKKRWYVRHRWLMPVILATWEAEIEHKRIAV
jgi:hypothetical protein